MTLQDIINGKGEFKEFPLKNGATYRSKEIALPIVCADGTKLSVQASHTHYCDPRNDEGPYSTVEVGYPTVTPPRSWKPYADGEYPSDIYAHVPVALVRRFVKRHGGEATNA